MRAVRCPECDYKIGVEGRPRRLRCPKCGTRFMSETAAPPKRSRTPWWVFALLIPSVGVLFCGGAVVVGLWSWTVDQSGSGPPPTAGPPLRPAATERLPPSDMPPGNSGGPTRAAPPDAAPVATLIAHDLFNAYSNNEAAADLNYTGKLVEVYEVCAPLFDYVPKKDRNGSYYLRFNCGIGWVVTTFRDSETAKLATFDTHMGGAKLTVRGKCRGLYRNIVGIEDAVLVSVEKNFRPEWRN